MKKYHVSGVLLGGLAMIIGLSRLPDNRSFTTIGQIVLGAVLFAASIWWYRTSKN